MKKFNRNLVSVRKKTFVKTFTEKVEIINISEKIKQRMGYVFDEQSGCFAKATPIYEVTISTYDISSGKFINKTKKTLGIANMYEMYPQFFKEDN